MKVKNIIEVLQETYDPDEELVIAWWGPELFEEMSDGVGREYPREVWRQAARQVDEDCVGFNFGEVLDQIEDKLAIIYQQKGSK
jgi:hypothetical protein